MGFINKIRNFIALTFIYSFSILALLYLSILLFIWSTQSVFNIPISYNLNDLLYTKQYFKWYTDNFAQLGFASYDYLGIKIIASLFLPSTIAFLIIFYKRYQIFSWRPWKKKESLHGDAKWAEEEDVVKAGLRTKQGMLLGQDKKGYYVAGGYQHSLLFAPTGSGKGVGFVIPNGLYWEESMIVHDIKLENYELCSGWRAKQGQEVYVWEPANPDGKTHCYNPIDWVSQKPGQMVDDVQKIGNLIIPKREFWENEARTLFVGLVLYLLAVPEKVKSFGEVVRTLRSDDCAYNLAVVMDTIGKYLHPVAYMNIAAFLQKAEKERSGVISTLNSGLELWANPLIDTATSRSDFNIQLFKQKKTTVFVGLTPDNIKRLEPLMKVFYQQASEFLSRKIPQKDEEPYGVLFLMDEFPTLGKMEQFKTGIAYFRGYHVRLFLIIQDTEQLRDIYEEAGMNSFLSNSTYRITFSANNYQTAELISKLCGNKTVEQVSNNKPKFLDLNPASRSMNVSETQRALLLPQEVINLPRDDQIVLIESFPPIRSQKIKYYSDKFFTKRLLPPIEVPTQEPYDPNKFKSDKQKGENQDNLLEDNDKENNKDGNDFNFDFDDNDLNDDDFDFDKLFASDEPDATDFSLDDNKKNTKQIAADPDISNFNFDDEEDEDKNEETAGDEDETSDDDDDFDFDIEDDEEDEDENEETADDEDVTSDDDDDFDFDIEDDKEDEETTNTEEETSEPQPSDDDSDFDIEDIEDDEKEETTDDEEKNSEQQPSDDDDDFDFDIEDGKKDEEGNKKSTNNKEKPIVTQEKKGEYKLKKKGGLKEFDFDDE